jgi:hypothetical protein
MFWLLPLPLRWHLKARSATHRRTEKERQLLDGRVGQRGGEEAKSHDGEKAWFSIIHSILSGEAEEEGGSKKDT